MLEITKKEIITFFKNLPKNIKKVNIILIGNSVVAGYKRSGKIKKLFERNNIKDFLESISEKSNVELCIYDFSKPQDNGNRRIYELLIKNVSISTMNSLSLKDISYLKFLNKDTSYIAEDDLQSFNCNKNIKINQLLKNNDKNTSSLVLFGGCTGRILETFFKNNTIERFQIFKSFKEDLSYLNEILDYLLFLNPSIPIFVSAIPKIKGLNFLINIFNNKIKKLCDTKFNSIFFGWKTTKLFYKDGEKTIFDFHPDYDESEDLIKNFFITATDTINYYTISSYMYTTLREYNLYNYDKELPEEFLQKIYNIYKDLEYKQNDIKKGYLYFYNNMFLNERVHDFCGITLKK